MNTNLFYLSTGHGKKAKQSLLMTRLTMKCGTMDQALDLS